MSEKRQALVATATELFAQHGFHATGVDRIAAASGVSKMTLYGHFNGKEGLITAALHHRHDVFLASLETAMNTAGKGLPRLERFYDWHQAWFRQPDFHGCLFIKASEEFSGHSGIILDVARQHKLAVLRLIEDCLADAGINGTKPLAHLLLTMTEGMIVHAHMFGPDSLAAIGWHEIERIVTAWTAD